MFSNINILLVLYIVCNIKGPIPVDLDTENELIVHVTYHAVSIVRVQQGPAQLVRTVM